MRVKKPIKKKTPTKKVAITKGKDKEVVREVEMSVSENREVQDGANPKSKLGGGAHPGHAVVGLSKGVTLNMGDFQSARIDVFIQRTVVDDDDTIRDTLVEIDEILQDEIERQSALLDD